MSQSNVYHIFQKREIKDKPAKPIYLHLKMFKIVFPKCISRLMFLKLLINLSLKYVLQSMKFIFPKCEIMIICLLVALLYFQLTILLTGFQSLNLKNAQVLKCYF